jgi:glucose-1-phosphate cytidylyltransferase
MKAIIFAGGRGTRLEDDTKGLIPKPMIDIAGKPMLEHIIDLYSDQGTKEFYVAGGYRFADIAEWALGRYGDPGEANESGVSCNVWWTGEDSGTGGRLWWFRNLLTEPFFATFGDGLSDVNLHMLQDAHAANRKRAGRPIVTLTAARPPSRFGHMEFGEHGQVKEFSEKPNAGGGWINAGFYLIDHEILSMIHGELPSFEMDVLPNLATMGGVYAYFHHGYFQMVDTWRDKMRLIDEAEQTYPIWRKWRNTDGS